MECCPDWYKGIAAQVGKVTCESIEWIARINADDVSDDDRASFEQWRDSHPLHARNDAELYSTWWMLIR
jgi:ferric-dicitrate binding protein FerR (iron transport regulator)